MSKSLTITCSNMVWDEIVEGSRPAGIGRSEWVETLIIKGFKYFEEKRKESESDATKDALVHNS